MNITIYKTVNCAYCPQTIKYLENHGVTPKIVDITYNHQLALQVQKATHSTQVPVVTIAESLEAIEHDNFYTGWRLPKLNQFIKQVKGE